MNLEHENSAKHSTKFPKQKKKRTKTNHRKTVNSVIVYQKSENELRKLDIDYTCMGLKLLRLSHRDVNVNRIR